MASAKSGMQILTSSSLEKEVGANAAIDKFKDHTDPKYVGPGTWMLIHTRARLATTRDLQLDFINFMKDTCSGFPCTVCKGHCTTYIQNHPLEEYLDILVDVHGEKHMLGMFVWSWRFHNAVNARIKKPIMSWDTAYNLYAESSSLVCSKSCMATAHTPDEAQAPAEPTHKPRTTHVKTFARTPAPHVPPFKLIIVNR